MANNFHLKPTKTDPFISEEECSVLRKNNVSPGTSYEVFRNNTTAVEVIVKEVQAKNRKRAEVIVGTDETLKIKILEEANESLTSELKKSNSMLLKTRHGYKILISELKKQLDVAFARDAEMQVKYLNLQLENEKLRSVLESKNKLVVKFKKEFDNLKRVVKLVIKGINFVPARANILNFDFDTDYGNFEKYLRENPQVKFDSNGFDGMSTFDSTLSKVLKNNIDK